MKPYFLYLHRKDRVALDLRIQLFESDAEACRAAAALLEEAPERIHVEVWDGERPITDVQRPRPD